MLTRFVVLVWTSSVMLHRVPVNMCNIREDIHPRKYVGLYVTSGESNALLNAVI